MGPVHLQLNNYDASEVMLYLLNYLLCHWLMGTKTHT